MMTLFEIAHLAAGDAHSFERSSEPQETLIVGGGRCRLAMGGLTEELKEGDLRSLDSPQTRFDVLETLEPTTLIRMCGHWGGGLGGCGLFTVTDNGTFDYHYHDCDEYWIIYRGRGLAISEGKEYEVGPGDCVATGMGHHHDFPTVFEPVKAVYFESAMEGAKRIGHLWDHEHGPASPRMDRV